MESSNHIFKEKTPKIILLIAVFFILAPFGNFATSFYFMNIPRWYEPGIFVQLLSLIERWDFVWNGLVLLSGVLLLFRRKLAWLVAAISLVIVILSNIRAFFGADAGPLNYTHLFVCMSSTLAALAIILHFKFPYLDRRDSWVKVNARTKVDIDVILNASQDIRAKITNLSQTGAFIECGEISIGEFRASQTIGIKINGNLEVNATIKYKTARGMGIQFENLTAEQKSAMKSMIRG